MGRERIAIIKGQPPTEVIRVTGGGKRYNLEHLMELEARGPLSPGGLELPDIPPWGHRRPSRPLANFDPEKEEKRLGQLLLE